jgi:phosphate starvation-inducible protein PhoH
MQLKQHLEEEKIALQSGANQISAFDSQTKRMDVEMKAQSAGATVNLNTSKAQGQSIDNQIKMKDLQNPYAHLSDEELIRMATGGQ